jgi:uncharacterized protein (DUF885 family)
MEERMRIRILSFLLVLSLCVCSLVSCKAESDSTDNIAFSEFTNEIFISQVSSDPLTLNYSLSHPENYGITALPNGFSSFTYEDLEKDSLALENMLSSLESFDKKSLSYDNQILYDILEDTLEKRVEGQTYLAFTESLGPTTGIQAQLPVLLSEFRIEDKTDLSQYFSLLRTVPDYFESLLSVEKEKSRLGTLPCQSTLSHIINQCEDYLGENGTALLETSFINKLSSCSFLSDAERTKAIRKNARLVKRKVIPAYKNLMAGLVSLIPLAGENGALCNYSRGKGYYEYMVRAYTGSSHSVSELESLLRKQLDNSQDILLSYAKEDPSVFTSCQDYAGKFTSPEQILSTLKESVLADFPSCGNTAYSVKYVDESLEDFLSPAFYLTPPIDESENNVIYINGADRYDTSSLFNTLAHEGYPGHLLQTCYMQQKNLPLLRYALDYGGYTEGWASYAEIYSYKYTGASEGEIAVLQNNMIATLCLYGLSDIGVHYNGWDENALYDFLKAYGTWDRTAVTSLYEAIVDEPASYLKYAAGYMEFALLKEKFRELDGDNYTDKRFHTFVLDMGNAPFSVLESYCGQH